VPEKAFFCCIKDGVFIEAAHNTGKLQAKKKSNDYLEI
jgi:hypothetical protein